ncbi:hypothetical protein EK21DRAFT_105400 [Setomelanomma holmii]|uniref:DUF590-domain-containing protein n=1 Tax=Setomelanomma holmii TaxID=210430 RepID=A0A9P4LEI2_9PLEO|nr:hypothetical protein EK21DRAFT_105400 [Setomelanomma holmii]
MQLRRADTTLTDDTELANITYNDKYVVVYEFGHIDIQTSVAEVTKLLRDLHAVGLNTEVRRGYDQSLLVFVQAPRELLGNTVYKSRVKDWLYSITKSHPGSHAKSVVHADFEAEDVLSTLHLVNWRPELGGAGITPGQGQWENVSSIFPLHNRAANRELLTHLSKRIFLTLDDLDRIRDLWGAKVAFYFAFLQTYFRSLAFPCVAGIFAWAFLPKYSLLFALVIGVWCTVFLEYWKTKETDLAIRWNVRGVGDLKLNRPQFRFDKEIIDSAGRTRHYFPRWKRVTLLLGLLITLVFLIETFISEAYDGPYKFYLEYMPTVLLAVFLPYATNVLEDVATAMTEYENHRTNDHHEMSLTQKIFVLNSITSYLPILLTAFVYSYVNLIMGANGRAMIKFMVDQDRLRNEVITLTLTGQLSSAVEELVLPWLKMQAKQWWRDRKAARKRDTSVSVPPKSAQPGIASGYNVQDDIAEMVIQFGYLALFSPVWPLVPIGFFINNWFELRSDFLKICLEHQRPAPIRSDGIRPWEASMECLTWLGSISSAAIVHLFGSQNLLSDRLGLSTWASLPIKILVSEHIFTGFRAGVRSALSRIGSEQTRKERAERYARRKRYLDELEASGGNASPVDATEKQRRKSLRINAAELFWIYQAEEGASEQVGISIIKAAKLAQEEEKATGLGKSD